MPISVTPSETKAVRRATSFRRTRESNAVPEKTDNATVARANLVEHLKNIDAACDDARLSNLEKIRRIKEEVEKAQDCLKRLSL
jgi:hypothetical protein